MKSIWMTSIAVVLMSLAAPALAATPSAVQKSIEKARDYLYSKLKDGNWETSNAPDPKAELGNDPDGAQWGGQTAVIVYALLASGESWQDARIKPAIEFLKKANLSGTYALGVRLQVWLYLPQSPEIRSLAKKDADELVEILYKVGKNKGLWGYHKGTTTYSLSRTQYGVFGLWAAEQLGVEVSNANWKMIEDAWISKQLPDGSWEYMDRNPYVATPGITAVGVASLFITQEFLHPDAGINCRGNTSVEAIDKGLAWMAGHMDKVATNEKFDRSYVLATLYAVERIGMAGGLRQIGNVDWFTKGADYLISEQNRNGSWKLSGPLFPVPVDTAFGILFLSRGRSPIVFGKLDYSNGSTKKPVAWNQRPRDIANLARWLGKNIEREIGWQVMDINLPVDELNDAPVLFISGGDALSLTPDAVAKLRRYCEQGGLIVAHSDCGNSSFTSSFRKLATSLFPQYEPRELPPDHPIYTKQLFLRTKWKSKPNVLAVGNGSREMMLLIPMADPGRAWQMNVAREKDELFQLGADIALYALDKQNLRFRGESFIIPRDPKVTTTRTIKLARIEYKDGNADPEPAGWRRFANHLANVEQVELKVAKVNVANDSLAGFDIAHLTGTTPLRMDGAGLKAIKDFVESGKLLIVDSCGGNSAFADSAEKLLDAMELDKPAPLPLEHPIYAAGKTKLTEVHFRTFAKQTIGAKTTPNLQVIMKNNKPVVIFSREDLSTGLVGQPVDGIIGYEPADALELMSRIVRYAGN